MVYSHQFDQIFPIYIVFEKKLQEKLWDNRKMDLPASVIQALFLWEISRWRALQRFIYVYILLDINATNPK